MEASAANGPTERDSTADWRVEPGVPVTIAELEGRIDVAVAIARTAEEAAMEIGEASLEAAEQARRAAALAERASMAAARAVSEVAEAPRMQPRPPAPSGGSVLREADDQPVAAASRAGSAPGSAAADEPTTTAPVDESAAAAPTPLDLPTTDGSARRRPDPFDERITAFRQRAERVMIRLQKLEAGADPGDGPSEVVRLG